MQPQPNPSASANPDDIIGFASAAIVDGVNDLQGTLEKLGSPIYVTDPDGWVTYFNEAAADFAGRQPVVGEDRWCVTWRLYTERGVPLPHDQCPMAIAIQQRRAIRGVVALAERPDGSRVMFTPYPTPVVDKAGRLIGGVNILVDVTDERRSAWLQAQAERCRRLAQSIGDGRTVSTLLGMATDYEDEAHRLNQPANPRGLPAMASG